MVRAYDKRSIIRARGIVVTPDRAGIANAKKAAYIIQSPYAAMRAALRLRRTPWRRM